MFRGGGKWFCLFVEGACLVTQQFPQEHIHSPKTSPASMAFLVKSEYTCASGTLKGLGHSFEIWGTEVKISLNRVSLISAEQLKLFTLLEWAGLSHFTPVSFWSIWVHLKAKQNISLKPMQIFIIAKSSTFPDLFSIKSNHKAPEWLLYTTGVEVCPLFNIENHMGTIESFRLEETSKISKSNH